MSKLKIVQGDLIHAIKLAEFDVVIHGCNCFHIMGGGIAKLIANNFPQAKEADLETKKADINKIGKWSQSQHYYDLPIFREAGTRLTPRQKRKVITIINAYTQFSLSQGEDVFQYQAFDNILTKLNKEFPDSTFALPWIGCGLAGGDKKKVIEILEKHAGTGMDLTVVQLEPVEQIINSKIISENENETEFEIAMNVPNKFLHLHLIASPSVEKRPINGAEYKHFKGDTYIVHGVGKNHETLEEYVFYESLKDGQCWIRPMKNFLENVKVNGELIPRFKLIEN